MKIVVDENIPYARELFGRIGDVITVPGRPFPQQELHDADALIVRSVTHVNADLLSGKPIKFVGTATAGIDHIDRAFLGTQGITFAAASGCNAIAVVEYWFSVLLLLAERDAFQLTDRTVGIVGVGNVGSRLQTRLEALGVRTLLCDPPRAARGDQGTFYPLEKLVAEADILTFHTPLIKDGINSTWHLVNAAVLQTLKPNTILVNACRGDVMDNDALLTVLSQRNDLKVVLDVWQTEPSISLPLLEKVTLGTAHIAGYTLEGKARGTTQVFEEWSTFIGQAEQVALNRLLPTPDIDHITLHGALDQTMLKRLVHLVYDVRRDDASLRRCAAMIGGFDHLRKHYPERREWSSLSITCDCAKTANLLNKLGFTALYLS